MLQLVLEVVDADIGAIRTLNHVGKHAVALIALGAGVAGDLVAHKFLSGV